MSRVLYRCKTCWDNGKQRDYHTVPGYRNHLVVYHGAKPSDLVSITRKDQNAAPETDKAKEH